MTETDLFIRAEQSGNDRESALAIRREVFVQEQAIPEHLDDDGKDHRSVHVLAFDGSSPVATARLSIEPDQTGIISRVAVLPPYRGSGLGGDLVQALERIATDKGLTEVTLEPHAHLEKFYGKLGFERIEGTSVVGDHELITMRKRLPTVRLEDACGSR